MGILQVTSELPAELWYFKPSFLWALSPMTRSPAYIEEIPEQANMERQKADSQLPGSGATTGHG